MFAMMGIGSREARRREHPQPPVSIAEMTDTRKSEREDVVMAEIERETATLAAGAEQSRA